MPDSGLSAKEAKAEAKAASARAKALRPWYKKKRFLLPLAAVVIVVVASLAGGGSDESKPSVSGSGTNADSPKSDLSANTENPPAADVKITSCAKGDFGPEVKVRVTNHSSKESDYIITIGFEDASGTKVGDGIATVDNVNPDQSAVTDVLATASGDWSKCKVEEVERFAS